MTLYQSQALGQIAGFYVIPFLVSALYFYKSKGIKMTQRILLSTHGLVFIFASLFAVAVSTNTSRENFEIEWYIFQGILILGIASVFYAIIKFKGSKLVHLSQVPNLFAAVFIWFVGGMTISHDWI